MLRVFVTSAAPPALSTTTVGRRGHDSLPFVSRAPLFALGLYGLSLLVSKTIAFNLAHSSCSEAETSSTSFSSAYLRGPDRLSRNTEEPVRTFHLVLNLMWKGNIWVGREVSKGSRFYFTITSQISHSTLAITLPKMAPFAKHSILFVDTLRDTAGVAEQIRELGLRPYIAHEVSSSADKEMCPHFDTIAVDSLSIVVSNFHAASRQTCLTNNCLDGMY